ncbi:hypothetical protein DVR12_19700 [Chitinophaga silvatica]|uniref:Uncharacterized protein n=1 Tax=Chitinophaga silvatica TaxID=2282649 RepID=A0A3E1Y5Y2_9BACT|nr:hypothetical protein [Chitinophaga silvatica]RFS19957.1 hypothetical protein DVR12_19700 [Chitinophaga silvatica]
MKRLTLIFLLLFHFAGFAQQSINNYKYVIVPEKFSFLKEPNQYGLNNLVQMVMNGKGFTAYVENKDLPKELATNKCNALMADVISRKAFLATNLTVVLKDCQGNVLFTSKEGKSREKDYALAYNEALTNALGSLDTLNYAYNGTTVAPQQATQQVVVQPAPAPQVTEKPVTIINSKEAGQTLYAQATENGFQLIDTTPKKVMTLLKTSLPDYFIADNGIDKGVVFRHNGQWYYEYYKDGKLVSEKLSVKF